MQAICYAKRPPLWSSRLPAPQPRFYQNFDLVGSLPDHLTICVVETTATAFCSVRFALSMLAFYYTDGFLATALLFDIGWPCRPDLVLAHAFVQRAYDRSYYVLDYAAY